jgi:hypothetical protein
VIQEAGGLNLFAYVANHPINGFDSWGAEVELQQPTEFPPTTVYGTPPPDNIILGHGGSYFPLGFSDGGGGVGAGAGANGNGSPKKPDLSKVPGCSELRKLVDSGKSPALTVQSFIENAKVWGFSGDNRGFTSSPADGISQTFRTSASVSWLSAPSGQAGLSKNAIYSGRAIPDVSGHVDIEHYNNPTSGETTYNRYVQNASLYAAASDPAFQGAAPSASSNVSVNMNFQTGIASGAVVQTDYPALQIFVGNQSVYQYSSNAAGKTPWDLYSKSKHTFAAFICDPSR